MQGDPQIFFQSFLELDRRNMISILAFDSASIKSLLCDKNAEYFDPQYPIFYKNKEEKNDLKMSEVIGTIENKRKKETMC